MKKLFFILALLFAAASQHTVVAQGQSIEVGYSTWAVRGVKCSSGPTAIDVTGTLPTGWHGRVAGYRIQNQDSADAVWLGSHVNVSTDTSTADRQANLGEKITAGSNAVYGIGYDNIRGGLPRLRVYCMAHDDSGAAGVIMSVAFFGY